jgi:hypothetical protein
LLAARPESGSGSRWRPALLQHELEAAGIVLRDQVRAERADQRAADFGEADAQADLQRRRHAQAGDDIGALADERGDQALGLGCVLGRGDRAGQQHRVGAHRGDLDARFGHRQCEHLVDAVDVVADADIGLTR